MSALSPRRESVTTINDDGSRRFLFPADVHGRFALARRVSALALIALYLSLPWIHVGGQPAVFLDVARRQFHLFGVTLATQDIWLLFFVISGLGFTLFFITALFGRIWCGWACPHTVFLDHVYRRIERWTEGDAVQRRALLAAPWSANKALRKTAKHVLYVVVSAAIAHLFLAYFISLPGLWSMVRAAPAQHWGAFLFMGVATGALYFNFAWFREQLCIVICPYGRLQSALIDDHSLVIGYDTARGEPRGKPGTAGAGDCVACNRCVQVCPTGIDIRQGLQMECVGCTACIDACDDVMTRLQRPRGLIRYDSQARFIGQVTRWLRPRTLLYGALLCVGASVATWALSTVRPATVSITRIGSTPFVLEADGVRNQFLVRIENKRHDPAQLRVTVMDPPAGLEINGFARPISVGPLAEQLGPLVLRLPRSSFTGPFRLQVRVSDEAGTFNLTRSIEFVGPDAASAPAASP